MEELDLSSCGVGDAGAEALALALAFNPDCLTRLDLSNNKVTDLGAKALGRALVEANRVKSTRGDRSPIVLEQIVLDNNLEIGDYGAAALADALACGAVKSVSVRSCSVRAEGAAAFGKAIVSLTIKNMKQPVFYDTTHLHIDLSGNQFGTLKAKKKKGAYSASAIREKASTHLNFIGKRIQSHLKSTGVSMGLTTESDDDEEYLNVMGGLLSADEEADSSKLLETVTRCGARSFSGEILKREDSGRKVSEQSQRKDKAFLKVTVGMRQCCLDNGAIDALSAAVVGTKNLGADLSIDVSMNAGVEVNAVDALRSFTKDGKLLRSMAKRHFDALEALSQARRRAALASESVAARVSTEMEFSGALFGENDENPAYSDFDPNDDDLDEY